MKNILIAFLLLALICSIIGIAYFGNIMRQDIKSLREENIQLHTSIVVLKNNISELTESQNEIAEFAELQRKALESLSDELNTQQEAYKSDIKNIQDALTKHTKVQDALIKLAYDAVGDISDCKKRISVLENEIGTSDYDYNSLRYKVHTILEALRQY